MRTFSKTNKQINKQNILPCRLLLETFATNCILPHPNPQVQPTGHWVVFQHLYFFLSLRWHLNEFSRLPIANITDSCTDESASLTSLTNCLLNDEVLVRGPSPNACDSKDDTNAMHAAGLYGWRRQKTEIYSFPVYTLYVDLKQFHTMTLQYGVLAFIWRFCITNHNTPYHSNDALYLLNLMKEDAIMFHPRFQTSHTHKADQGLAHKADTRIRTR